MADDEKPQRATLDRFESGKELGPIQNREEREQRLNDLPPDQKELAHESARLADLSQYFSARRMDMPSHIAERVSSLPRLQVVERIRALREINQALMEYLNDGGEDPQIRH
jgi:hypothetical protein